MPSRVMALVNHTLHAAIKSPTHECRRKFEEVKVRKRIRDICFPNSHQAPRVLEILLTTLTASDLCVMFIKIHLFNLT